MVYHYFCPQLSGKIYNTQSHTAEYLFHVICIFTLAWLQRCKNIWVRCHETLHDVAYIKLHLLIIHYLRDISPLLTRRRVSDCKVIEWISRDLAKILANLCDLNKSWRDGTDSDWCSRIHEPSSWIPSLVMTDLHSLHVKEVEVYGQNK